MQCYNCNSKKLKYNKEKDAYICLNCEYEYPKQYFFISHSHLDIEKVRIIRNIIEETFFYEPILFFLKCLSEDEEIKDLVQREINERIWFVYCKSENSEKSKYVQQERKYIDYLMKKGKNKNLLTIELDEFEIWNEKCYEYIRNQISYKIRKTKIFLSFVLNDKEIAKTLHGWFTNMGYSVLWNLNIQFDIKYGEKYRDLIEKNIRHHSYKDGIILSIFTKNSLKNSSFMAEFRYSLEQNAIVVPIVVKGNEIMNSIPSDVLNKKHFILDSENIHHSLEHLLKFIEQL